MEKANVYEHTINTPLVLAGPAIPQGKQGHSLLPVLRGKQAEVHDAVFGYFTDTQRMIRMADG